MKILYGVQGTGNGHLSRTRMMARHLQNRNADVTYLFSGRPREQYFDMDAFGDFICRQGFTFVTERGRVKYGRTLLETSLSTFYNDIRTLDISEYDLILTDYEPITAWAGRLKRKPVIGIGHQYAFWRRVPMEGQNVISRQILNNFAPASISFGLHWAQFDEGILPPIVDPEIQPVFARPQSQPKVLVYLPFEDQQEVTSILQQISGYDFYQYGPGLTNSEAGQVRLRRQCRAGFLEDLASSTAVICNAGFELVSESLQLGLQVLVRPVAGQTEQLSNALAVQELGIGARIDQLSVGNLTNWLHSQDFNNKMRFSANYPDVAASLVDWVLAGDWHNSDLLADRLWSQCPIPGHEQTLTVVSA